MVIQYENLNLISLIIFWFVFFFGIGSVSQISLRNSALHYRKYQGTVSISLLIFGDGFVTLIGFAIKNKFPTNSNRVYDQLIIIFFLYLIPMWISLFIIIYFDFEKDKYDNTQQVELTFKEYMEELYDLYSYQGLCALMLIEFGITILSFFLVQINYNFAEHFSEIQNHCFKAKNYKDYSIWRNVTLIGCIFFAYLVDKNIKFITMVRVINFFGGILGVMVIIFSIIDIDFFWVQIIFLGKYILICGFYSVILGKTLKIFSPAKMMEVTGFIGIAPAFSKIIRMLFEEYYARLFLNNDIKYEVQKFCDKINYNESYDLFGAWLYFKLKDSNKFYLIGGFVTIVLNIIAIFYIRFIPEIEVPLDVATPSELKQNIENVKSSQIEFLVSEDEVDY